jgi:hypothetical protein
MFFFGIFGIQQKDRSIKEFDNIICPDCGRLTRAELRESYTYFHFFFIPLIKWNRQCFLQLRCCGSLYMVDSDYVDELKRSENVDFVDIYINPNVRLFAQCCIKITIFTFADTAGHKRQLIVS